MKLDRFLDRVHRRWMLLRLLERVGFSILISSIVAAILSIVLISRGESALAMTGICLAIGILIGAIVGWLMRPSLFDAAVEIDRQLKLSDLLATALSVRQSQTVVSDSIDGQWSATIIALAESRCASIENEPLILRRFGARAWGGIGLCAATVLTLGVLSTNPLILQARSVTSTSEDGHSTRVQNSSSVSRSAGSVVDPQHLADPESAQRSRMGSENGGAARDRANAPGGDQESVGSDQSGSGAAKTNDTSNVSQDLSGTAKTTSQKIGQIATGGGNQSTDAARGNASSGIAADSSVHLVPPPWTTQDWPRAQQHATEQLQSGSVPDAYRDLVRDYFSH